MNRRQVLTAVGAATLAAGAGYATVAERFTGKDSGTAQSITVEDAMIGLGNETRLTVQATQVGEMYVSTLPPTEALTLQMGIPDITATPSPSLELQSYPPYWLWETVEPSVTVEIPIRAEQDAAPDEYTVEVTARNGADHGQGDAVSDTTTITIDSAENE